MQLFTFKDKKQLIKRQEWKRQLSDLEKEVVRVAHLLHAAVVDVTRTYANAPVDDSLCPLIMTIRLGAPTQSRQPTTCTTSATTWTIELAVLMRSTRETGTHLCDTQALAHPVIAALRISAQNASLPL